MKKKKMKLDQLKVQSFVTEQDDRLKQLKGGDPFTEDVPTINDSCFTLCANMCNDFPSWNINDCVPTLGPCMFETIAGCLTQPPQCDYNIP